MAQQQGNQPGAVDLAALSALNLPADELAVILNSQVEKEVLTAAGIGAEQIKALEAHRKAKLELSQGAERERAKRLRELGNKVELTKAGPDRLDHWACLTYLQHIQQWRDVPEHLEGVDDSFFLAILLNHLSGHPHQLISTKAEAIRREFGRVPTWVELETAFKQEYCSKTPERDNRFAMYRLKWEQGSLSEFVSQFRILLTRCQGDGLYLGVTEVMACDQFQKAILQHGYASEELRRNQGNNMAEWKRINELLDHAQSTYGHLMMHPDPNKRQRTEGGRFGQGRFGQGGRSGTGRGRES
jgi:hypothetical protein